MRTLLSWLTGGGISAIGAQINEWQRIKLAAQNDADRLHAEQMIAQLKASEAVILQAQRDPFERWIRILLAAPWVVYNFKLVVWDKVLGLGATDPLSDNLMAVQATVIGGYFLHSIVRGK